MHVVNFRGEDLVKHELYVFPNEYDTKLGKPNLSDGELLVRTETEWAVCGDTIVPSLVHTTIYSSAIYKYPVSMTAKSTFFSLK